MKDLDADPTTNAVDALGEVTARRRDAALASLVMVGFYLREAGWKKTCSCSCSCSGIHLYNRIDLLDDLIISNECC